MQAISYLIKGSRAKPTLLLLHGFLGRGEDWLPLVEDLSESYCCVVPDLPGHGVIGSRNIEDPLSFDSVSTELEELLRQLDIEEVSILGYSLGSRIALHTAIRYPKLISKLIIESGTPGIQNAKLREQRVEKEDAWAEAIERDFERFIEQWYSLPLFETLDLVPERKRSIIESRIKNEAPWMAKTLRELGQGTQRSLWNKLETIKQPTLLIAGERDSSYREILSNASKQIPNSSYQIISGAGHLVHREKHVEYLQCIKCFLSRA